MEINMENLLYLLRWQARDYLATAHTQIYGIASSKYCSNVMGQM